MASVLMLAVLSVLLPGAFAVRTHVAFASNPIRRVVTMLQSMQSKIVAEGKRDAELFEKFDCYCRTGTSDLEKSIEDAETKIPQLESGLKGSTEVKAQLESELAKHKADRADALSALAQAKSLRESEAAAFAKESSEHKTNLDAMTKAIAALEKGVGGAFLQTSAASRLRQLTVDMDMSSTDRDELSAFLSESEGQGYSPQSGEIIGIVKQMKDTFQENLAEAVASETDARANYLARTEAMQKQVAAVTQAIESKLTRVGEVGVQIVTLEEDLEDTTKALAEDQKFLNDLQKNCKTRDAEYEKVKMTRADELLAIAETIKLLNDDEALDLFKKTLPSPSFLQTMVSSAEVRRSALLALQKGKGHKDMRLDFISMSLRRRSVNFDKVIVMVDNMMALLGSEQKDDDSKKAWCEGQLDEAEDQKKELDRTISDLKTAIDESEGAVDTLVQEIAALVQGINDLDKQVADATVNRKSENEQFEKTRASDSAAKELLRIAKNRLSKFYNKAQYVAPAKKELSEADQIDENISGTSAPTEAPGGIANTGVTALDQEVPPPSPEAVAAYQSKDQESAGVMKMLDILVADLDKELQQSEVEEKEAQTEYDSFMADAGTKRSADAKSITEKEGAKSGLEATLVKTNSEKNTKLKEAMEKAKFINDLHVVCDWLMQNYDSRKAARADEVDSLKNAKAVLSGADYSLVETSVSHRRN